MNIIEARYEILDELDGKAILEKIERIARVCYKSEDNIKDGSAEAMVKNLIARKHEAMLEHFGFSVLFTVDRGVSHELVRHRLASFAQESTRYCNYGKDGGVTFIKPLYLKEGGYDYCAWERTCETCANIYTSMLQQGLTPQEARAVLPNSLKTEIVVTANLREWRHILALRAVGTTGKPHPQMAEVMRPLLDELKARIPIVFDDLSFN